MGSWAPIVASGYFFCCAFWILAHVSRRVTVRLKIRLPWLSAKRKMGSDPLNYSQPGFDFGTAWIVAG